jgi:hypothetical protein
MNAEQHAFAREIVENARLLCNAYLVTMKPPVVEADPRGYVCCAIGELALGAGHTVGDLIVVVDQTVTRYTESLPLLASAYGLSEKQCDTIACANDEPIEALGEIDAAEFVTDYDHLRDMYVYDMQRARKAAVLRTLDSFVAAPALAGA